MIDGSGPERVPDSLTIRRGNRPPEDWQALLTGLGVIAGTYGFEIELSCSRPEDSPAIWLKDTDFDAAASELGNVSGLGARAYRLLVRYASDPTKSELNLPQLLCGVDEKFVRASPPVLTFELASLRAFVEAIDDCLSPDSKNQPGGIYNQIGPSNIGPAIVNVWRKVVKMHSPTVDSTDETE